MNNLTKVIVYTCFISTATPMSCTKSSFLDTAPNGQKVKLKTIDDAQYLMDNVEVMNSFSTNLDITSGDNHYIKAENLAQLEWRERNAYTWQKEIFEKGANDDDWFYPNQAIYYTNLAMAHLDKFQAEGKESSKKNYIRGQALFKRALAFYNLAQVFVKPYDKNSAGTDLGIPLRLTADFTMPSVRSTVQQTYDQVIKDLKEALALLPDSIPVMFRIRPSAAAARAMLARVYLSMRDYDSALLYADSCLQLYNTLIDYTIISQQEALPFGPLNAEVIYQCRVHGNTNLLLGTTLKRYTVDSNLYRSYAEDDLRRLVYYTIHTDNLPYAKGGYSGTYLPFTGLATDEIYLIRAECYARIGNLPKAIADLNTLLEKRFKQGTFVPIPVLTGPEVMQLVLQERRKELVFRGLRWTDLRRLNLEGDSITLRRVVEGKEYLLPPNDKRYTLPIPPGVIDLTGMQQNQR